MNYCFVYLFVLGKRIDVLLVNIRIDQIDINCNLFAAVSHNQKAENFNFTLAQLWNKLANLLYWFAISTIKVGTTFITGIQNTHHRRGRLFLEKKHQ